MKKTLTLLLLLYFLLNSFVIQAQKRRTTTRKEYIPSVETKTRAYLTCDNPFPTCFIGNWKGELEWFVNGKPTRKFAMQLIIKPADSAMTYTWQIIYGENGKDNRPYLLKPVDTAKGHWIIDERDGIILDSYIHGSSLHGAFTVQGNTIVDNYTVDKGKMLVEFFSIKLDDKTISGKGTEDVPLVNSYKISSYQKGVLVKGRDL
jgi:hypothetical protein